MRTDIEQVIQTYYEAIATLANNITDYAGVGKLNYLIDKVPQLEDLYLTYRKNLYEIQDLNAKIQGETDARERAYMIYDKRHYLSLNEMLSAKIEVIIFEVNYNVISPPPPPVG